MDEMSILPDFLDFLLARAALALALPEDFGCQMTSSLIME
jgi:hypothetical protein